MKKKKTKKMRMKVLQSWTQKKILKKTLKKMMRGSQS